MANKPLSGPPPPPPPPPPSSLILTQVHDVVTTYGTVVYNNICGMEPRGTSMTELQKHKSGNLPHAHRATAFH